MVTMDSGILLPPMTAPEHSSWEASVIRGSRASDLRKKENKMYSTTVSGSISDSRAEVKAKAMSHQEAGLLSHLASVRQSSKEKLIKELQNIVKCHVKWDNLWCRKVILTIILTNHSEGSLINTPGNRMRRKVSETLDAEQPPLSSTNHKVQQW